MFHWSLVSNSFPELIYTQTLSWLNDGLKVCFFTLRLSHVTCMANMMLLNVM